jgi:hypothetical protein
MSSNTNIAAQHTDFPALYRVARAIASLRDSFIFARLCQEEWNVKGKIDAEALERINRQVNYRQAP